MKHIIKSVTAILLLSFSLISVAEEDETLLKSDEIKRLFANATAICTKQKDLSTCVTYMGADGLVKRLTHTDNVVRKGTWSTDEEDHLCILWEGKTKDLCFTITALPNKTYLMHKKGKLKSTILGFMPGDTIGDFDGF